MPFETTKEKLKTLMAQAFKEDDISQRADEANLSEERLFRILSRDPKEIWDPVSDKIANYNADEEKLQKTRSDLYAQLSQILPFHKFLRLFFNRVTITSVIVLLITVFNSFAYYYSFGDIFTFLREKVLANNTALFAIPVAVFMLIGLFREYRRLENNQSWSAIERKIGENLVVDALQIKLPQDKKTIEDMVIRQGIKPQLKEIIENQLSTPFKLNLPELNYNGLSEVFDSANEVATEGKQRIDFLFQSMSGGSIGIAGPRGAGKTTLLKSVCKETPGGDGAFATMPVLTSAPVEYQSRDFILHLFSTVCMSVRRVVTGEKKPPLPFTSNAGLRDHRHFWMLPTISQISLVAGCAFLFAGILIALVFSIGKFGAEAKLGTSANQVSSASDNQTQEPAPDSKKTDPGFMANFITALEIKPGSLFSWGIMLLLFHFAMRIVLRYQGRYIEEDPSPQRANLWTSLTEKISLSALRSGQNPEVRDKLEKLNEEALEWQKRIKFQQSYTSGWSGNLKLPIGLEGGLSEATSLSQQQLSLPEIVQGFCDFIKDVSEHYRLIIGIDELDKLESDESAQKFLNEIKAIFGQDNVFYLISVSENAMSNFERRGLPFRDVFDSSFDEIIRVDYLNFDAAKRLIARRVLAMPPPFTHLCFCLSGGLARDLVRTCRDIMELSRRSGTNPPPGNAIDTSFSFFAQSLIKDELQSKINATIISAKKLDQPEAVSKLIAELSKFDSDLDVPPTQVLQICIRWLKEAQKETAPKTNGQPEIPKTTQKRLSTPMVLEMFVNQTLNKKPEKEADKTLVGLKKEIMIYVYYCITLLEFFNIDLDANKLSSAERAQAIEKLAKLRQLFSLDVDTAKVRIGDFRTANNMLSCSLD